MLSKLLSRKFIMSLATTLVVLFGDLGLNEDIILAAMTSVYVVVQSIIDHKMPSLSGVPFLVDDDRVRMKKEVLAKVEEILSDESVTASLYSSTDLLQAIRKRLAGL